MDPTPPPDIIAATKYIFQERGAGSDALDKMWVTNVRHEGPLTLCDGWLVRYPLNPERSYGAGGPSITIGGSRPHTGTLAPIVETRATVTCSRRQLTPFGPSPAPSP